MVEPEIPSHTNLIALLWCQKKGEIATISQSKFELLTCSSILLHVISNEMTIIINPFLVGCCIKTDLKKSQGTKKLPMTLSTFHKALCSMSHWINTGCFLCFFQAIFFYHHYAMNGCLLHVGRREERRKYENGATRNFLWVTSAFRARPNVHTPVSYFFGNQIDCRVEFWVWSMVFVQFAGLKLYVYDTWMKFNNRQKYKCVSPPFQIYE